MPKFGDWIMVKARLKRTEEIRKEILSRNYVYKNWIQESFEKPRRGIFLGSRTLANGRRDYYGEEGFSFTPAEYIKAYLVCTSAREKPFYVHPDDIETITPF